MEDQSQFDSFELHINETAIEYLRSSAKWSMFLAIMGFIGIGLMILGALAIATIGSLSGGVMGGIPGMQTGIAIIYIVMALLYFFPIYYLYKYASDMKNALNQKDNELLTNSLGHLKSHHKFLGVSIIVIMSLYALFIIGMIIFGLGSRF
jgi:Family of unknown function (DUF5362)